MKKTVFALILAAALCCTAFAAGVIVPEFDDVGEDAWYYADVMNAAETGLVNGKSDGIFAPDDSMTYAEAVKLAACMRQLYVDKAVTLTNGDPWYQTYADYALENGIIEDEDYPWNEPVIRAQYMALFAHALPEEAYAPINEIADGSLPDVNADDMFAPEIYLLARAGIVQGDERHYCKPDDEIRRCEVAAILTRMMDPEARVAFTVQKTAKPYEYVGKWDDAASQRAHLTILPGEIYGNYDVKIHWAESAFSAAEWTMTAVYDETEGKLCYENGKMAIVTSGEDGTAAEEERWNDAEGFFLIGENGEMTWTDSREERSADFRLVRTPVPAPTAEELADGYFRVIGGYAEGTAGASLKAALAARDAVRFAAEHELWTGDRSALRTNLLAAWESLSAEEQAAFDANFISVLTLADACEADWEGQAPLFGDAGASDMGELIQNPFARLSWTNLKGDTLTMGNTPGK